MPAPSIQPASRINLRPARAADLAQVHQLERLAFGDHAYSAHVLKQYLELFAPFFHVATTDAGDVVAHCIGGRVEPNSGGAPEGWFMVIVTHPDHRRQGLAQRLGQSVIDSMRSAGIGTIRVTVAPTNTASQTLLAGLGFTDPVLDEHYFGPGDSRLIMTNPAPS